MASENELTVLKPEKRAPSAKLSRRLAKLTNTALDCLEEILTDESVKSSDRITAVKLTFDIVKQQAKPEDAPSGEVKVVFEGIPKEWAE
ncbi:MAG: hypothetical protein IJM18_00460 [Clostridia bacterium]|jgi:hypothetical protein|nr:hypothetical protein [Clostridia bacterium]